MDRRGFLKGCLGGAAGFLLPVPMVAAIAAPTTVSAPWENPVDVLEDICKREAPWATIDRESFDRARECCEAERPLYVVGGDTVEDQILSCLNPMTRSLWADCRGTETTLVLRD